MFFTELVSEFMSVRWKDAPSNERMVFGSSVADGTIATPTVTPQSKGYVMSSVHSNQIQCAVMSSKQMFKGKDRRKRECVVCRYEGRYLTAVTDYCLAYTVCLCRVVHDEINTPFTCSQSTWTCWDKFHDITFRMASSATKEISTDFPVWPSSRLNIGPIPTQINNLSLIARQADKIHPFERAASPKPNKSDFNEPTKLCCTTTFWDRHGLPVGKI
ncbi:unnamed protein product [Phytophthora fragariaefolia]|uniref:Unnamed protein product n=1 Tax=Phytophthora fragariaefolia TaxID=1490495 RepID=A0A9W6XCZ9_9STRA|nr:unnamed protein product [Phytophthora fragariaefolia]